MVEHRSEESGVEGSSPLGRTIKRLTAILKCCKDTVVGSWVDPLVWNQMKGGSSPSPLT